MRGGVGSRARADCRFVDRSGCMEDTDIGVHECRQGKAGQPLLQHWPIAEGRVRLKGLRDVGKGGGDWRGKRWAGPGRDLRQVGEVARSKLVITREEGTCGCATRIWARRCRATSPETKKDWSVERTAIR